MTFLGRILGAPTSVIGPIASILGLIALIGAIRRGHGPTTGKPSSRAETNRSARPPRPS